MGIGANRNDGKHGQEVERQMINIQIDQLLNPLAPRQHISRKLSWLLGLMQQLKGPYAVSVQ